MCASGVRLPQEVSTYPEVRDEFGDHFIVRCSYIRCFATPNLRVPVVQILSDFLAPIYNQFRMLSWIPYEQMRLPFPRLA
jgi:hypothetical protein